MPLWDIVVSIFWFMILITWIWLLIAIFSDIFRDHELSGWGKALWSLGIIIVPWLGALAYLVVRGRSMNERALAESKRREEAFGQYVVQTAAGGSTSTADELAKLADLREKGTISDEEFEHAKAKTLGREPASTVSTNSDQRSVPSTV